MSVKIETVSENDYLNKDQEQLVIVPGITLTASGVLVHDDTGEAVLIAPDPLPVLPMESLKQETSTLTQEGDKTSLSLSPVDELRQETDADAQAKLDMVACSLMDILDDIVPEVSTMEGHSELMANLDKEIRNNLASVDEQAYEAG